MIATREENLMRDVERFRKLLIRSTQMQMLAPGVQAKFYYVVDKGAALQLMQDTRHWFDESIDNS